MNGEGRTKRGSGNPRAGDAREQNGVTVREANADFVGYGGNHEQ